MQYEILSRKFKSKISIEVLNGEPWFSANDLNKILPFLGLKGKTFVSAYFLLAKAAELFDSFDAIPCSDESYQNKNNIFDFLIEVFHDSRLNALISDSFKSTFSQLYISICDLHIMMLKHIIRVMKEAFNNGNAQTGKKT
jgi:hypothetical protein